MRRTIALTIWVVSRAPRDLCRWTLLIEIAQLMGPALSDLDERILDCCHLTRPRQKLALRRPFVARDFEPEFKVGNRTGARIIPDQGHLKQRYPIPSHEDRQCRLATVSALA